MPDQKHIVVLTGAGISAESGLKTFRDSGGLWEEHDIYKVATPEAFARDPELVLRFYNMRRTDVRNAQPNVGHRSLAELESKFRVSIITQNIDDLHERAGSSSVLHLHGEILKARSVKTEKLYPCDDDIKLGDCCPDGGQLRPHVVWFGEMVPMIEPAALLSSKADIYLVVGTSLQVYPAAGLLHYVPSHVPKYVIDPGEVKSGHEQNIVYLKEPASSGVPKVVKQLFDEA